MLLLPFFSREDTTILKSRCARCAPPPELNSVAFALRHSRAQRMNPPAPFIYIGAEGSTVPRFLDGPSTSCQRCLDTHNESHSRQQTPDATCHLERMLRASPCGTIRTNAQTCSC